MEYNNEYKTMTMTIDDVPEWIHHSELYRNFEEGEGEFQVNSNYVVSSSKIENIVDFRKVIEAYLFWSIDEIPRSVFEFVTQKGYNQEGYQDVKKMFHNDEELWDKLDMFEKNIESDPTCIDGDALSIFSLVQSLANKGYNDCIEFCISFVQGDEKIQLLRQGDVYLQVIESNLKKHKKIQAMTELKNIGFEVLHTRCVPFDTDDDYTDYVIWLHQNGGGLDSVTLSCILENETWELKHHSLFLYFLNSGLNLTSSAIRTACEFDNVDAVKLLIQFNCPCDEELRAVEKAIKNQNIEIMRLLYDYGCPMRIRHLYLAATHGLVNPFEFLVQRGCPWNDTVIQALERDTPRHNRCLEYIIEHGDGDGEDEDD